MYLPAHFEEHRPEVLHELLRRHPLGLLVTQQHDARLEANAIPFLLDTTRGAHGTLVAHVARANPLWRQSRTDVESLVVFQGPQAYVTPSWYASKAESGKVVPTWNYVMVEARGALRVHDDAEWVHRLVETLTDRHEAGRAAPWKVGDAPDDYVLQMRRAIVGIEIELTSLAGKWKVSQNRSAADRAGVAQGLQQEAAEPAQQMAALVRGAGG